MSMDYFAPDSFLVFSLPLVLGFAPWSTRSFHGPWSEHCVKNFEEKVGRGR